FLARDRIGIKPLYYTLLDDAERNLVFASEIKAILECPKVDRTLDVQALYQFMGFEFVPSPETIFRKIYRLAPGFCLTWRRGTDPKVERYWRLRVRSVKRSRAEHEQMMRDLLRESVQRQLIAD